MASSDTSTVTTTATMASTGSSRRRISLRDRMSLGTAPTTESKLKDSKTIREEILPQCRDRPRVFNKLTSLASTLMGDDDGGDGDGDQHFTIPELSNSKDSLEDCQKDVELLEKLLQDQRKNVLHSSLFVKLGGIKRSFDQDLAKVKQTINNRRAKERQVEFKVFTGLLPKLQDRPHVYNMVMMEIEKRQAEEEIFQQETRSGFFWTRQQEQRQQQQDWVNSTTNVGGFPIKYLPVPSTGKEAMDRWLDVERLDEICDLFDEGSATRRALEKMKKNTKEAAVELQKRDADRVVEGIISTRFKLLNKFAKSPSGRFLFGSQRIMSVEDN